VSPLANEEFFGLVWMRSEENRKFQLSKKKSNSKKIPTKSSSDPRRKSVDSKFKAPSREDLHHRSLWSQWASRKDSNLESS
jgi:hypothetical protein